MCKIKKSIVTVFIVAVLTATLMVFAFAGFAAGDWMTFFEGNYWHETSNTIHTSSGYGASAANWLRCTDVDRPGGYLFCHIYLVDNRGYAYNYTEDTNDYTTSSFGVSTPPRNVSGYLYHGYGYSQTWVNGAYGTQHWPQDSPWISY